MRPIPCPLPLARCPVGDRSPLGFVPLRDALRRLGARRAREQARERVVGLARDLYRAVRVAARGALRAAPEPARRAAGGDRLRPLVDRGWMARRERRVTRGSAAAAWSGQLGPSGTDQAARFCQRASVAGNAPARAACAAFHADHARVDPPLRVEQALRALRGGREKNGRRTFPRHVCRASAAWPRVRGCLQAVLAAHRVRLPLAQLVHAKLAVAAVAVALAHHQAARARPASSRAYRTQWRFERAFARSTARPVLRRFVPLVPMVRTRRSDDSCPAHSTRRAVLCMWWQSRGFMDVVAVACVVCCASCVVFRPSCSRSVIQRRPPDTQLHSVYRVRSTPRPEPLLGTHT